MPEPGLGPLSLRVWLLAGMVAGSAVSPLYAETTDATAFHLIAPEGSVLGGLSAIEVSDQGRVAVVLSDRGTLFSLALIRDAGQITDVEITRTAPLTEADGSRDPAIGAMDAEGLARGPDGTWAISFEGAMRIGLHAQDGREVRRIAAPPGWEALPYNKGFEALAIDGDGRIYTLAEDQAPGTPMPLHVWTGSDWQIAARLPQTPGYSPVALSFDDRGRLHLLERRFSLLRGFSNRLTRFDPSANGFGAPRVMAAFPPGHFGNLEGLSLWRRSDGALVATLVSDDNFTGLLQSLIVELVLPD